MYYWWSDRLQHYTEYDAPEWWMIFGSSYYRRLRVQQERREWYKTYDLAKEFGFESLIPRRAPHSLDPWDIEARSTKADSKSWKALNKCNKQYQKKKYDQYLN